MSRLFILTLINALIVMLPHLALADSDGTNHFSELAVAMHQPQPVPIEDVLALCGLFLSIHYLFKVLVKKPFSFKPVFYVFLLIIHGPVFYGMRDFVPSISDYIGFALSVLLVAIPGGLLFRFLFKQSYKIFVLEFLLALIIWPLLIGFALLNFELGLPSAFYGFLGAVVIMSLLAIRHKRKDEAFPIKKLAQVQIVIALCFFVLPWCVNLYKEKMEKREFGRLQSIQFIEDVSE